MHSAFKMVIGSKARVYTQVPLGSAADQSSHERVFVGLGVRLSSSGYVTAHKGNEQIPATMSYPCPAQALSWTGFCSVESILQKRVLSCVELGPSYKEFTSHCVDE